jgi:ubiquinone biosynthesis UbiH/UbiF/VisC/COQ6 family hydroxylase
MQKKIQTEVAIVGGGVVGSALALALAQQGVDVVLTEARAPEFFDASQYDLRVFALSLASVALLERIGVWSVSCSMRVSPYQAIKVWEKNLRDQVAFESALIGEEQLGWIVEDRVLRAASWQALQNIKGVRMLCPARAIEVHAHAKQALLKLDDGQEISAQLVVAADGVFSPLREQVGIEVFGHAYHQRAVVTHVQSEKPHQGTAWQRFTPEGPLAFLPLVDGRSSIVWSVQDAVAESLLGLDDLSFCDKVTEAFDGRLGKISACTSRAAFPLRLQLSRCYVGDRVVLVGDSAHVVHPLAGQGLNLGLQDVAVLAQVLVNARRQSADFGEPSTLRFYDRLRRRQAQLSALAFDGIEGAFRGDLPGFSWARRQVMSWINSSRTLKRELTRHASGWVGQVPDLMRRRV